MLKKATTVAQFDGSKPPLNDVKPMSTAFRELQVLPLRLEDLIVVIEFPK